MSLDFPLAGAVTRGPITPPSATANTPCNLCKQRLTADYWRWHNLHVCPVCRPALDAKLMDTQSSRAFFTALKKGGATALAAGFGYALFVELTDIQLAFITIGIAIAVAKAIRDSTHGLSGPKFQALAVALTYLASTMGYAPVVYHVLVQAPAHAGHAAGFFTWVFAFGVMLVLPFTSITEAPLGTVIVLVALWSAWKRTVPVALGMDGPYRIATPPDPAP